MIIFRYLDTSIEVNGLFEQAANRFARESAVRTDEDLSRLSESCLRVAGNMRVFEILSRQSLVLEKDVINRFLAEDAGVHSFKNIDVEEGGLKGVDMSTVAIDWVDWKQSTKILNEEQQKTPSFSRPVEGVVLSKLFDRFQMLGKSSPEELKSTVLDFDNYPRHSVVHVLIGVEAPHSTRVAIDSSQTHLINPDVAGQGLANRADYISQWQEGYYQKMLPFVTKWMKQS